MAITIKLEPNSMHTAYNESILVLDSTNKTKEKFQFVVDVKINGSKKSRIKMSANPDGFGVFDLHKHISPYVSYDIDVSAGSTFRRVPNTYTKYNVDIYEEYVFEWDFDDNQYYSGNVGFISSTIDHPFHPGERILITQDPGYTNEEYNGIHNIISTPDTKSLVTDVKFGASTPPEPGTIRLASNEVSLFSSTASLATDKYYFNGVLNFTDVTSWNESNYKLTGATSSFLSNNPDNMFVELDDRIQMNIYNHITNNARYLEITSNNGTFRIENIYWLNQHANKFLSCYVGPWDILNTSSNVTIVSGSLPILDSNTTSYTVKTVDNTFATTSETKTFTMINKCSPYEKYKLVYLDRFGAFTSVSFNMKSRTKNKVKRDIYQKNHGTYNSSSNTWGYNNSDRGKVVFNQEVKESITINSDWVNESTGNMIVDMIESPEVYHLNENGELLAINILTSGEERKKTINDIIFNYTINFEYSFTNNQQRQ